MPQFHRHRATTAGGTIGLAVLVMAAIATPAVASPHGHATAHKGKPGPVKHLAANPGSTAVSLTWDKPANGVGITKYRVYESTTKKFGAAVDTTSTLHDKISGLSTDTTYYFAVTAVNASGAGIQTVTKNPVSVGAPGSVTGLKATGSGASSVALSWAAPSLVGGDAISGYSISAVEGGSLTALGTVGASKTAYTATNISSPLAYVVKATNTYGSGPSSEATGQPDSTIQPADTGWTQLTPADSPPDTGQAAIAYDGTTGQLVMFGGFGAGGDSGQTWTWDGTDWTLQHPDVSPEPADGGSMAYDAATRQLIMFGGENVGGEAGTLYSAETWSWTGSDWRRLSPTHSPAAAGDASMAYDAATRQLVLYGGISSAGCSRNTWTWSGTDWTKLAPKAHPDACSNATMAYDDATGQLILFGGNNDHAGTDATTWNWTGSNWANVSPASGPAPAGVAYGSLGYSGLTGTLILTGGFNSDGVDQGDTWRWNGTGWRDQGASGPPAGNSEEIAYDAATAQLILLGETGTQAATWSWGDPPGLGLVWSQSTLAGPSQRDGQTMAYDPATSQIIMFGGEDQSGSMLADTWAWSSQRWTHLHPATSPAGRTLASMAYDNATGQLVLFGGLGDGGKDLNDTWSWTGTTWQRLKPTVIPSARLGASMAYDDHSGQLILFGGGAGHTASQATTMNDTWNWTGKTWTKLTTPTAPAKRDFAGLTFDPDEGGLVLSGITADSEQWVWTGTGWTQPDPSLRATGDALAFDPYNGGIEAVSADPGTLFGRGVGGAGAGPPYRAHTSMAYDPASGQVVVFGGVENATTGPHSSTPVELGDTWLEYPRPSAPQPPTGLVAFRDNKSVELNWSDPLNDGGSAITGYNVYAGTSSGGESATPLNSSPFLPGTTDYPATGLQDGTTYYFTVVAINSIGTSLPSNEASAETFSVPSSPRTPTADAGDQTATVHWSAPASDGGTPVTGYNVYQGTGEGGESATPVNSSPLAADATSYQVTGLTDAVTYNFSVVAINEIGSSGPSDVVSNVTPFTNPDAPTPTALVGNGQLKVTWVPGADNGGPIQSYNVYAGTTSGGESSTPVNPTPVAGTATSLLVSGLTNGTTYYFTVIATNAAGASPVSAEASASPALVPATLTVGATSSTTKLVLSWKDTPPASGVSTTTGYNVYRGTAAGGESSTPINASPLSPGTVSYQVPGLSKGTDYWFVVEAVNSVGPSLPSNEVTGAIETVPSTVRSLHAVAGSQGVKLTWVAPTATGGVPVTGYDIYQSTSPSAVGSKVATVAGSRTSAAITGLTNGTTYSFTVRAVNVAGMSPDGSDQVSTEPIGPPPAPVVTATAGRTTVTLSWHQPTNGGSPITHFHVSGSNAAGQAPYSLGTETLAPGSRKITIGGLHEGRKYVFSVSATNKYGTSAAGTVRVTTRT
jgi:hypothetical protein